MVKQTKNKGEWTEIYTFLKLLADKTLKLADKDLNPIGREFVVNKVSTLNIAQSCFLSETDEVIVKDKNSDKSHVISVQEFLNHHVLKNLADKIKNSQGASFDIPEFHAISSKLGVTLVKGGNSNQKSDIILDIQDSFNNYRDEGFGIKSYLGNKPTLLNASGNTNFIYKVKNLSESLFDTVNAIETRTKLKDRIMMIVDNGGSFEFKCVEQETMGYNLDLVDSCMPKLVALMLLEFHQYRCNKVSENLQQVFDKYGHEFGTDFEGLKIKVKKLLVAILLGFFAGSKWNGQYLANGTIVVKQDGSQIAYHITDLVSLEDYLYEHIIFDTPSTTRHRYGALIKENNELHFKLNLQLRF